MLCLRKTLGVTYNQENPNKNYSINNRLTIIFSKQKFDQYHQDFGIFKFKLLLFFLFANSEAVERCFLQRQINRKLTNFFLLYSAERK